MKDIFKQVESNKLLLKIDDSIYEKEAVLNASYKFTDKCYINIESVDSKIEVYFRCKDNSTNIEEIALSFENELIDQQVRINIGREFKEIREGLVKKAFSSISK